MTANHELDQQIFSKLNKLAEVAEVETQEEDENDDIWEKKEQERKVKLMQQREKRMEEPEGEHGELIDGLRTGDSATAAIETPSVQERDLKEVAINRLAELARRIESSADDSRSGGFSDDLNETQYKEAKDNVDEVGDGGINQDNGDADDDISVYTYSTTVTEGNSVDEQWESAVMQLELVVGIVLIPLAGKFLGRRFAHKVWGILAGWIYGKK